VLAIRSATILLALQAAGENVFHFVREALVLKEQHALPITTKRDVPVILLSKEMVLQYVLNVRMTHE